MKFRATTLPLELVEFVKNNTSSKEQLGIPVGHRYVMNPRHAYGFQYNDGEVGPHYLPYTSYVAYRECFKRVDWMDEHCQPITYRQAIERMIMVHREHLSHLYQELKKELYHVERSQEG